MKRLLSFLFVIALFSCKQRTENTRDTKTPLPKEVIGEYTSFQGVIKQDAMVANLSQYNNKTIRFIEYCDACATSGDVIKIEFTDGTKLNIYAYKYNMKILY